MNNQIRIFMKQKMAKVMALIILAAVLVMTGCYAKHQPEKTAEELAAEGQAAFQNEDYQEAIKAYEKLTDWYPFSSHVKTAELRIADSHYEMEEYEEAILAYKEFERLHPNDEHIPLVIYRIGRCYFDRMVGIDREQTTTQEALQVFLRLVKQYPKSKYAEKAKAYIKEAREHIAGHEFYVGKFYFKQEHYKGALYRFLNVVHTYPDLAVAAEARDYVKKTRMLMAKTAKEKTKKPVIEPVDPEMMQEEMQEPDITDPTEGAYPQK